MHLRRAIQCGPFRDKCRFYALTLTFNGIARSNQNLSDGRSPEPYCIDEPTQHDFSRASHALEDCYRFLLKTTVHRHRYHRQQEKHPTVWACPGIGRGGTLGSAMAQRCTKSPSLNLHIHAIVAVHREKHQLFDKLVGNNTLSVAVRCGAGIS